MRIIKFRAWDGKRMYLPCISSDGKSLDIEFGEINGEFDNHPIMQYTGLNDKNGKEVYESDLVSTKYQKLAKIVWEDDSACFATETVDKDVIGERMYCLSDIEKVIGNVFENPELVNK